MVQLKIYSKDGCLRCRQNRKKCDEVKPICSSCRNLNVHCSYDSVVGNSKVVARPAPTPGNVTNELGTLKFQDGLQVTYFQPLPECRAETHQIFQYYAEYHSKFTLLSNGSPAISLLKLLPIACSDGCSLLALSAVLTGFLPDSAEQQRLQASLSTRTMSSMRVGLSVQRTDSLLNLAFLAACMLYLLQLHSITEAPRDRVHLYGMGAILVEKVRMYPNQQLPLTLTPTWLQRMIAMFAYHLTISSTVDHTLLNENHLGQIMDHCVNLIRLDLAPDMFGISIMGIPTCIIPIIVRLSRLRKEIINKNPTEGTIKSVIESQREEIEVFRAYRPLRPLGILFKQACSILRATLLTELGLPLTFDDALALYDCMDDDVTSALNTICTAEFPHHTITWPLLVIGLVSCTTAQQGLIHSCLQRMIENSRLRSVRGVLETLTSAWQHRFSASILLLPQIGANMTF